MVAITDWNGQISPVFDEARTVRLFDRSGHETGSLNIARFGPGARAERLRHAGVTVLLCGAISPYAKRVLTMNGMVVHAWLHGVVDRVHRAYREGWLWQDEFTLPGCQDVRNRTGDEA